MESFSPDNTPIHASIRRSPLANEAGAFVVYGLLEGVVLRARFKDDPSNLSREWTEYDILEVSTRQIYLRARLSSLLGGLNNFEENVLAETTGVVGGGQLVLEDASAVREGLAVSSDPSAGITPTESYRLNGERVVFGCMSGVYSSPVILGVLPHPQASFSARRTESPRHNSRYNKWTTVIDKDENLSIKHDDGRELVLHTDGSLILRTKDNNRFEIDNTGAITIVKPDASLLKLGSVAASSTALRGELTNSNIELVMSALVAVGAAISSWLTAAQPQVVNPSFNAALTTAMTTTLTTAQTLLASLLPPALSDTVKVP